jgi:hypothetical protein
MKPLAPVVALALNDTLIVEQIKSINSFSDSEARIISVRSDHQQQLSFRGALLREPGMTNDGS